MSKPEKSIPAVKREMKQAKQFAKRAIAAVPENERPLRKQIKQIKRDIKSVLYTLGDR
jgi:hypothetical protein